MTDCVREKRRFANGRVPVAGCVSVERVTSCSRVAVRSRVAWKRTTSQGRVVTPTGVVLERTRPAGCIPTARGVETKGRSTGRRVLAAGSGVSKRAITKECIGVAIAALFTDGSRLRRKRKGDQGEQDEKEAAPPRRPQHRVY